LSITCAKSRLSACGPFEYLPFIIITFEAQ
jgi:hypothetical protein